MFLLDVSGSISPPSFNMMIQFITSLIPTMVPAAQRIGIATFSTNAKIEFNLGDCTDKGCYTSSILKIRQVIKPKITIKETHTVCLSISFYNDNQMSPRTTHFHCETTDLHVLLGEIRQCVTWGVFSCPPNTFLFVTKNL